MTWQERFSVFVPGHIPNGARVPQAEPRNNWQRLCDAATDGPEGFSYQFMLRRVDKRLTDGLTDCFSSWGQPCPGEPGDPPGDNFCSRPERISYFGWSDVVLDDNSIGPVGTGDGLCDMNCDGAINAFDIEPFLDLLFDPKAEPCGSGTGDANGDGIVGAFDIEPFLECLFPQPSSAAEALRDWCCSG